MQMNVEFSVEWEPPGGFVPRCQERQNAWVPVSCLSLPFLSCTSLSFLTKLSIFLFSYTALDLVPRDLLYTLPVRMPGGTSEGVLGSQSPARLVYYYPFTMDLEAFAEEAEDVCQCLVESPPA